MQEIWKNVKNYEGLYQVSNLGKIKTLQRRGATTKIIKPKKNSNGYLIVGLHKNGIRKEVAIQRLVAIAFIKNLEEKPEVNHIDGNKENNNVFNLEWVTHKENMEHARNNNLIKVTENVIKQGKFIGKKYGKQNGKKRAKKVSQIDINNKVLKQWNSITEANKYTGISISGISRCCNNKKEKARGYRWKFVN